MEHPVSIVTTKATPTAVVRESTTWQAFPNRWRALLDETWSFVRGAGLTAGRNVMLYTDDVPNVEVGVEVGEPFAPGERVVPSTLPAGRAARTVHRGPPSPQGIDAAHAAVLRWCAAKRGAHHPRPMGGVRTLARRSRGVRDRGLLAAERPLSGR